MFNFQMMKLSISLNHRKMFIGSLVVLILLLLVFVMLLLSALYFLSESMNANRLIYMFLNNIVMNGGTSLNLISLLVLLYAFHQRFQLINLWITNNFQTEELDEDATNSNQDDVVLRRKISRYHCALIYKISGLHDCLVDCTMQFNRCFAFQLFSAVGSMFCINIFSTFAIYRVFVRKDYVNFYKACIQFSWNAYYAAYGLSLITLCSLITRAGKYTAVLVHKAINYIEDDEDPVIDAVSFAVHSFQFAQRSDAFIIIT